MTKSKELAIVKTLTNVNDETRIVLNGIGWTSRIYIIDDGKFVFKFPKNKRYREELKHETGILKLIKEYKFNVDVPLIHWIGQDNAYIGFSGIAGKSMTTEIVNKLSEEQKKRIGSQIGLFLKKLHTIDYKGKSPNNENKIIGWLHESFCKEKCRLKNYFNEKELATIEKLVTDLSHESVKLGIDEVFCHGDLGYNNIIVNANLEVGIIDFGDAGNLDKSYDFTGIENDVILDAALSAYNGDDILRKKVLLKRRLVPLMEILFLIDGKEKNEIENCAGKMRANLD